MSNESIVYVVQDPPPFYRDGVQVSKDLSSAQRYGVLKPILSSRENASLMPGPVMQKFMRELNNFNPIRDYIAFCGGDPLGLSLALLALRELSIREVNFLRWERERSTEGSRTNSGFYVPTPIRLY
jgi:hypothetical protein